MDRRAFIATLAAAATAAQRPAWARPTGSAITGGVALYASVGGELFHYEMDVAGAALSRRGSVVLPAMVQYAWPHASRRFLYVASSNGGPGVAGDLHHASAFRIDVATGALISHGEAVALPSRPIHVATDAASEHLLIAYNDPSGVTVHRINGDGTLGGRVAQPRPIDAGIFAHQVRVTPSARGAILVTRGNDAAGSRPEDPGSLEVFGLADGILTPRASIAPDGGFGFGPRHLDFHPSGRWVYVSVERQNQLWVFRMEDDAPEPEPVFRRETLAEPREVRPRQIVGTVHLHPNGRFAYVANRADGTVEVEGRTVFNDGENSIAVFALDERTGEPTLVQHADTRGIHPRTFHIDPTGQLLVAANVRPLDVREGSGIRTLPASLSVFRIGDDGRLAHVRKYDVDVGRAMMFWMGMVPLPAS